MNTKLRVMGSVVMVGALLLGPGCATNGGSGPNVAGMTLAAKSAAYLGTKIWVDKHPADRAVFERARSAVKTLIAAGEFSAADLSSCLQALPIKELQGDSGTLIVGTAVVLWDQYGKMLVALDANKTFETYVLPVAKAIAAGMDLALDGKTSVRLGLPGEAMPYKAVLNLQQPTANTSPEP